jgi:HAMP domain-containing protein
MGRQDPRLHGNIEKGTLLAPQLPSVPASQPFGIAAKLVLAICTAVLLLFGGIFAYDYYAASAMIYQHAEENARAAHAAAVGEIRNKLIVAETTAETLARAVESAAFDRDATVKLLRTTIAAGTEIFGATVALAPGVHRKNFAPYFHRTGSDVRYVDLTENYDYTSRPWYAEPAASGRGGWSEPYFDEGGGEILMTTYSAPLFREVGGVREFAGVATADISLEWLKKLVGGLRVLDGGYGFLISREGRYLSHANKDLVMHATILDVAAAHRDPVLADIGKRMMAGDRGLVEGVDPVTHRAGLVCFGPLGHVGWSLGIVYDKNTLLAGLNRYSAAMLVLALIGVICLLAVVELITGRITGPLRSLAVAAGDISMGNLDAALPQSHGGDEIGRLTDAFADMRDSLKRFIASLAGRNEELQDLLRKLQDSQLEIEGMVILDAHLVLTGLTVVQGAIDLYEQGIVRDPARTMADIKNALAPIERIVETLKMHMPLATGKLTDAAARETRDCAEFLRATFADIERPAHAPALRVANPDGLAEVSLPYEALAKIVRHVTNLALLSGAAELRAALGRNSGVCFDFQWDGECGVANLEYADKPFRLLETFGTEDFGEDERVNLEQLVSLDIVNRLAALSGGTFACDIAPRPGGRFVYALRLQYSAT